MTLKTRAYNLARMQTADGVLISFTSKDRAAVEEFFAALPDEVEVEMARPKRKRSLDANAYAWTLLDKLAAKLDTTSVEVYREIIRRVGVFDWVLVTKDRADDVMVTWARIGLGWIAERVAERDNGIVLRLYKGSSVYTVDEMTRLIREIQSECEQHGIETKTPDELNELMERWKNYE